MRNLKRALSLALASVMLVGMMVVGTSAASYPDVDDSKHNIEAIEVLNAVKVMQGDAGTGNFRPDDKVSRNEMAVIMARLVLGNYEADSYVGSHPFTDVPTWASRYVAACYNSGIINGTSATTYSGTSNVTAVQAAAMMLRALGYEDLSKPGQKWDIPVAGKANEVSLFKGLSGSSTAQLTRNDVAKLALNALKADVVITERTGFDMEIPGVGTINSNVTYKVVTTSGTGANNYAGAGEDGDDCQQLCEKLYPELTLTVGNPDDFGRPGDEWFYDGDSVITATKDATRTYTEEVEYKEIYKDLGLSGSTNAATVYTDGDSNSAAINLTRNDDTPLGGNGVLVQVYKDGTTIDIVVVNTYLAQVSGDYDEDDEELTIGNVTGGSLTFNTGADTLSSDDFAGLADFEDEDYVLITAVLDAGGDVDEVKTIVLAETITATVTGYTNDKNVTFDGKKYEYSENYEANGQDRNSYAIDEESVFIMDSYGYVIGLDEVAGSDDYVYVDDFDKQGDFRNAKDTADAYFPDGTNKTIVLKNAYQVDGDTKLTTTGSPAKIDNSQAGWYTYTVKNDEYTITQVENFVAKADITGNVGADTSTLGAAKPVTENGKVTIHTASPTRGNNKTVFVVLDDDDKITVYEGIKNVPDISVNGVKQNAGGNAVGNKVGIAVSVKSSYANYVFIDASNEGAAHIKGSSSSASDLIYILKYPGESGKDNKDNSIITFEALVNGSKKDVIANASGIFTAVGLYNDVAYDSDGYVDDASHIADASDENYKYYDFSAATFDGVDYKDGVLAVSDSGTPANDVDFIMADSFTIYTVDGTTVKTVTADKLAKDYDDGFNDASVRGKVWAVLNDDEEVTSLYVDIKGVSAGTPASYVSNTKLATASTTAGTFEVTIGGKAYEVAATNTTVNDQVAAWVAKYNADDSVNTAWTATASGATVTVTYKTDNNAYTGGESAAETAAKVDGTFTDGNGTNAAKIVLADLAAAVTTAKTYAVTIDGKTYNVATTENTVAKQLTAWCTAYETEYTSNYTAAPGTDANDGKIVLTAKSNGVKVEGANNYDTYLVGGVFTNGTAAQA